MTSYVPSPPHAPPFDPQKPTPQSPAGLHRFRLWLQSHIQASAEAVGKPFALEEWGKQWSEQQRNEMFRLVQVRPALRQQGCAGGS